MSKREYLRSWLERNRDHVKAYRAATRDQRNARRRELYRLSDERRAKAKATVAAYKKKHPYYAASNLYGVPQDELERLMDRGCMICGAGSAPGIKAKLHVDHDHRTNEFRGVLCEGCNHGLGKFYDDPVLLHAAADYLLDRAKGRAA
jgi:hypothetical protein